jgi:arylsulfatase A-like enzyme
VQRLTGVTEDVPGSMWFELDSGRRPITATVRQRLRRAYRAELTAIDRELQRLFDYLKQSGRWERSIVVVWADHGQLLGERGYVGHAYTLEEELIRVPLIVKPAAGSQLTPGVHPHLIQEDDLFALSQVLAGMPNTQGAEVVTAISRNTPGRRFTFSKIHHDPLPELTAQRRWRSATQWAARDTQMKIVRDLEGRSLAYDVTGPEERLVAMPDQDSPLVAALDRFRAWMERMPSTRTVGPLTPAEIERLRALGYIQ